jgi:predicted acetyltransferase
VTDDITIAVPTADEWDAIYRTISTAFNEEPDEAVAAIERLVFEPERSLVARRGGEIVGTAGIYTRGLSVPGAAVPAAHVTLVAVDPMARRQGILTRFMQRQFADIRAAGESVAVLWASEGRIYQRFGYGLAVRRLSLEADTSEVTVTAPVSGRLRLATPAEFRDDMVKVYDEAYANHNGWSERTARHWDFRLADPDAWRRGASALRAVVHDGEHGVDGYALWRVKTGWSTVGADGEVRVIEQVSTTPASYAALWQFLLTVDLTRTTNVWACAVDEPLQYLVNEPRRLASRLTDALWLRVIDVPAALTARRYAREIDIVLDVSDPLIEANTGRWRLTGGPDGARCAATDAESDLSCDVRALGSAYLGGAPLSSLAAAGLVREHRPGALAEAGTAFGWHRPPSAIEMF